MQPDEPASENLTTSENSRGPKGQPDAARVADGGGAAPGEPTARRKGSPRGRKRLAETRPSERTPVDSPAAERVPYRRRDLSLIDRGLLWGAEGAAIWRRGLRWVRSQLPRSWQAKLPDEILTAIFLGLLFLLLALWHPLGGSKATTVAMTSEPEAMEQATSGAPEAGPEVSPEQTLIADIQEQVAEITQSYAAGLIQSVQANFQQGSLQIDLGPQWYDLTATQQNQLAQDLYGRTQELSFSRLALFDDNAVMVARSPVVGLHMVILQRSLGAA